LEVKKVVNNQITVKDLQAYIKTIDHKPELKMQVVLKLIEEVGELAVEIRKESLDGLTEDRKQNIKYELYDVLHFVNHIANIYDIDLVEAIQEKDEINKIKYDRKEETK
jgi:NTP pyrophosphatase (non-canonical NTP hydrolase)